MSVAKALNLAIAIIEDRPKAARDINRSLPLEESRGLSEMIHRLRASIDRRVDATVFLELRKVLHQSMPLEAPDGMDAAAFFEGVSRVETIVDEKINELRKQLDPNKEINEHPDR